MTLLDEGFSRVRLILGALSVNVNDIRYSHQILRLFDRARSENPEYLFEGVIICGAAPSAIDGKLDLIKVFVEFPDNIRIRFSDKCRIVFKSSAAECSENQTVNMVGSSDRKDMSCPLIMEHELIRIGYLYCRAGLRIVHV